MCDCGSTPSCNITAITKGEKGDTGATGADGAGFLTARVTMSAAELLTGNSVPIDAIAAPGAGLAIEIISASVKYVYATAAFGTGKYLTLQASTGTYAQYQSGNVLNKTSSRFSKFTDTSAIIYTTPTTDLGNQLVDNDKITIKTDADSATGGGNVIVYITYRLVTI